jgi:hypothetical protein
MAEPDAFWDCLREFLKLNLTFKPILLAMIQTVRTYLQLLKVTLNIKVLRYAVVTAVTEPVFDIVDSVYGSLSSGFDNVAQAAGGIPCTALDQILEANKSQIFSVATPYFNLKAQLLDQFKEQSEYEAKIAGIDYLDDQLAEAARVINEV